MNNFFIEYSKWRWMLKSPPLPCQETTGSDKDYMSNGNVLNMNKNNFLIILLISMFMFISLGIQAQNAGSFGNENTDASFEVFDISYTKNWTLFNGCNETDRITVNFSLRFNRDLSYQDPVFGESTVTPLSVPLAFEYSIPSSIYNTNVITTSSQVFDLPLSGFVITDQTFSFNVPQGETIELVGFTAGAGSYGIDSNDPSGGGLPGIGDLIETAETTPLLTEALSPIGNIRASKDVYGLSEKPVLTWDLPESFTPPTGFEQRIERAATDYAVFPLSSDQTTFTDASISLDHATNVYYIQYRLSPSCDWTTASSFAVVELNRLSASPILFEPETFSSDNDISINVSYGNSASVNALSQFITGMTLTRIDTSGIETVLSTVNNNFITNYTDENVLQNVIYNYKLEITGTHSSNNLEETLVLTNPGFYSSMGIVNGHVQYEGGTAVEGVEIEAVPASPNTSERSMDFDGTGTVTSPNWNLLNGAENQTVEAWINTSQINVLPDPTVASFEFDGVDDRIAIDDFFYSGVNQPEGTVETWVKTTSNQYKIVASFDRSDYWRLALEANGDVSWNVNTNGACAIGDQGALYTEFFDNIPGNQMSNLEASPNYPDNPTSILDLYAADIPNNLGENYGTRSRGFIRAPETGNYTFNVTGDDNVKVYLSTGLSSDNNVSLICRVAGNGKYTNIAQHDKYPMQTSGDIFLEEGNYYHIEIIHKGGGGENHANLYWKTPSDTGNNWSNVPANVIYGYDCSNTEPILDLRGSTPVNDGEWHHIVAVYDKGVASIYVDGVLDVSAIRGTGFGSTSTRYGFIGVGSESGTFNGLTGPDDYFEGEISGLRIWNRARTQEELSAPVSGTEPGIILDFQFDQYIENSNPNFTSPITSSIGNGVGRPFGVEFNPVNLNNSNVIARWGEGFNQSSLQLNNEGELTFTIGKDFVNTLTYLADGYWHHVAYTLSGNTLADIRLFVDGVELIGNVVSDPTRIINIGNSDELILGESYTGKIDEFRIWNISRTGAEIAENYTKFLNGNEPGLAVYWQANQGGDSKVFDFSTTDNIYNGFLSSGVSFSTNSPGANNIIGYKSITDENGNYSLRLPYVGDDETYTLTPSKGVHSFDPMNRVISIGLGSEINNNIDFTDISSFEVSGNVFYEGIDCASAGTFVKVDGEVVIKEGEAVRVQADGSYSVDVPIGEHFITLEREGHGFGLLADGGNEILANRFPTTGTYMFQNDTIGIDFVDTTQFRLIGRVVGGLTESDKFILQGESINNIGQATMELTAEGSCHTITINTDPLTGEYDVLVPPLDYNITSLTIPSSPFITFDTNESIQFANSNGSVLMESDTIINANGDEVIRTVSYHERRDFTHRESPNLEVIRANSFVAGTVFTSPSFDTFLSEESLLIEGTELDLTMGNPFGHPIFLKNKTYDLEFYAYEKYTNRDAGPNPEVIYLDPLRGGTYSITNNLTTSGDTLVVIDSDGDSDFGEDNTVDGRTSYSFIADNINLLEDVNFPNLSFTRTFEVLLESGGNTMTFELDNGAAYRGIVLGDVLRPGSFTTHRGPDLPLEILHDPPGDSSYSYIEEESTSSTTFEMSRTNSGGVEAGLGFHVATETSVGLGLTTTLLDVENTTYLGAINGSYGTTQTSSLTSSTTMNQRIETRSAPSLPGAPSDLFIGRGTNILFGVQDLLIIVPVGECGTEGIECSPGSGNYRLATQTIPSIGMELGTHFIYDQTHVEQVVIRDLEFLRDAQTNQDSINLFQTYIDIWTGTLTRNEKLKVEATEAPLSLASGQSNISFTGEIPFEYSEEFSTESTTTNTSFYDVDLDIIDFELLFSPGLAIKLRVYSNNHGETTNETGFTQSKTHGFVLQDDSQGDFFSVDIKRDSMNAFVFSTVAGASSCPYEPAQITQYFEPGDHTLNEETQSHQRPVINASPGTIAQIPENEMATFTLTMGNDSDQASTQEYGYKIIQELNPNGAIVNINGPGAPIGTVVIDGGGQINQTMTVRRGSPGVLTDTIYVVLHSTCQYSQGTDYQSDIADTTRVVVHYQPTVTGVDLVAPYDGFVSNIDDNEEILFVLDNYDINDPRLERVDLQFKEADASVGAFQTFKSFYKDITDNPNEEPLSETNSFTFYTWDYSVAIPVDGFYDFRAVVRGTGVDNMVTEGAAEIIRGRIDRTPPGVTARTSELLSSLGEDLQLTFSESILDEDLSIENFDIRGILESSSITEEAFAEFEGEDDFIHLRNYKGVNGDLERTVEFLINTEATDGSIVRWGAERQGLNWNIGLEAGLLKVDVVGDFARTNTLVNDGEWHHVAVVLEGKYSEDLQIYIDGNLQDVSRAESSIEIKTAFAEDVQIGGSDFAGQLKEFRIWNIARTSTEIVERKGVKLLGNETGLVAYLPMEELSGGIAYDHSRDHDGIFSAQWGIANQGQAYQFTGNPLMTNNVLDFQENADFTVSLWFKSISEGQLLQTYDSLGLENWDIAVKDNGQLEIAQQAIDSENLLDNEWHHLSIVRDEGNPLTVYVDGLEASNPQLFLSSERGQIQFGNGFVGEMDDIRIWRAARTKEQILRDKQVMLKGNELGLMAYYTFETGFEDYSDNANDLEEGDYGSFVEATTLISQVNPKQSLGMSYQIVNNKVLIFLDESTRLVEGGMIDITVDKMRDINGNSQSAAATWSIQLAKNQLYWQEDAVIADIYRSEGENQFQATLLNLGDQDDIYHIDGLPSWLELYEDSGDVRKKFQETLTFEVNDQLKPGRYEHTLYAIGNADVVQPLRLAINVAEDAPEFINTVGAVPNPFSEFVYFSLDLNEDAEVGIIVRDVAGRVVHSVPQQFIKEGYHEITWEGDKVQAGVYFVEIITNGVAQIVRVVKSN